MSKFARASLLYGCTVDPGSHAAPYVWGGLAEHGGIFDQRQGNEKENKMKNPRSTTGTADGPSRAARLRASSAPCGGIIAGVLQSNCKGNGIKIFQLLPSTGRDPDEREHRGHCFVYGAMVRSCGARWGGGIRAGDPPEGEAGSPCRGVIVKGGRRICARETKHARDSHPRQCRRPRLLERVEATRKKPEDMVRLRDFRPAPDADGIKRAALLADAYCIATYSLSSSSCLPPTIVRGTISVSVSKASREPV
ncbi:hypothetical protein B0H13DRAFT_1861759 [Mycena leptocephala]|nr:hypothetical protein B0H13DRAFT_1861759 [Mycena leptocephala]